MVVRGPTAFNVDAEYDIVRTRQRCGGVLWDVGGLVARFSVDTGWFGGNSNALKPAGDGYILHL